MPRNVMLRVALVAGALFVSSAAQAAVLVTIDKSIQQMTVAVDGRPLYQWPVSTGKGGYDTPNGKFKAFRMERDHFSKEWDEAPMPFSIFFTQKGHAIHGSLDVKRLGTPASHGCVRLLPANAEKLFALVEQEGVLNTTVVLTGVAPSGAPAVARRRAAAGRARAGNTRSRNTASRSIGSRATPQPQYAAAYGQPYYAQPLYAQPQYASRNTPAAIWPAAMRCRGPATSIATPMASRLCAAARQHVSVPVSRHLADVV